MRTLPRAASARRHAWAAAAALAAVLAAACGGSSDPTTPVTPVAPPPPVNAVRDVHDPGVAVENGVYVVFSTGPGIPVRRSRDLKQWETAGVVFGLGLPPNATTAVPGVRDPWAPDGSYFNGVWHLYYSLSTFGSQRSAIGVATSPTLDPSAATTRWTDQGIVLQSAPGLSYNAIDPNVVLDAAGQPWLSWGSFWGGLKLRRLDAATGKLSATDTTTYSLAARQGTATTSGPNGQQAVEAPAIVRRGAYYYLFASYDACCQGTASTYNIRVGRSAAITGPYVDRDGVDMAGGGGTLVLAGAGAVRGPGGQSVLVDAGQHYLVHHFYDEAAAGAPTLQVRPLTWDAADWPVAGAPLAP